MGGGALLIGCSVVVKEGEITITFPTNQTTLVFLGVGDEGFFQIVLIPVNQNSNYVSLKSVTLHCICFTEGCMSLWVSAMVKVTFPNGLTYTNLQIMEGSSLH